MDTNDYMEHMDEAHTDGSECLCDGPVDLNYAAVPTDKNDPKNYETMCENIKERFDLD